MNLLLLVGCAVSCLLYIVLYLLFSLVVLFCEFCLITLVVYFGSLIKLFGILVFAVVVSGWFIAFMLGFVVDGVVLCCYALIVLLIVIYLVYICS